MSTFGLHTHAQVVRFVGRSKLTQRSASDTQMGSLRHRRASGYILLSRTGENVISAACLVRVSLFRYHIVVILNLQNTWVQCVDTWPSLSLPFLPGY